MAFMLLAITTLAAQLGSPSTNVYVGMDAGPFFFANFGALHISNTKGFVDVVNVMHHMELTIGCSMQAATSNVDMREVESWT